MFSFLYSFTLVSFNHSFLLLFQLSCLFQESILFSFLLIFSRIYPIPYHMELFALFGESIPRYIIRKSFYHYNYSQVIDKKGKNNWSLWSLPIKTLRIQLFIHTTYTLKRTIVSSNLKLYLNNLFSLWYNFYEVWHFLYLKKK